MFIQQGRIIFVLALFSLGDASFRWSSPKRRYVFSAFNAACVLPDNMKVSLMKDFNCSFIAYASGEMFNLLNNLTEHCLRIVRIQQSLNAS